MQGDKGVTGAPVSCLFVCLFIVCLFFFVYLLLYGLLHFFIHRERKEMLVSLVRLVARDPRVHQASKDSLVARDLLDLMELMEEMEIPVRLDWMELL